jgi:AcrR family transcriptional regulator
MVLDTSLMARAGLDQPTVVAAAADLANAEGLSALTLTALAIRLKVKPPSLLHHVGSLNQLRRQLALAGMRGLKEAVSRAALGLAGADAIRAMAHAYRAYARAHPGVYEASQVAPDPDDAECKAALYAIFEVVAAAFRIYGLSRTTLLHEMRALRASLHGFVALEARRGFGLPESIDTSFKRHVEIHIVALEQLKNGRSAER